MASEIHVAMMLWVAGAGVGRGTGANRDLHRDENWEAEQQQPTGEGFAC